LQFEEVEVELAFIKRFDCVNGSRNLCSTVKVRKEKTVRITNSLGLFFKLHTRQVGGRRLRLNPLPATIFISRLTLP